MFIFLLLQAVFAMPVLCFLKNWPLNPRPNSFNGLFGEMPIRMYQM